jgi:hypothetical protein
MPTIDDAWAEPIGIFKGGKDVTKEVYGINGPEQF